ncbi:MAG: glycosyltransferase family 4 protein [Planctomycetota bacterium]|nr:glycosyltransferase family 4 protein [Planctomycetota bacterium]
MKIIQITPGAGGDFYCDNCLRDNALALELRRRGHDALMVPLYLPMAADGPDAGRGAPIFFGGINVYLQQKSAIFRRTPRWLDRLLDSPRLLARVARRAGMTRPADLGEVTLSMLRGEEGRQMKELQRLVAWLSEQERPDLVCLSNALLLGMARPIKSALGVPLVCLLQDEDAFLDAMPEPYRGEAWGLLGDRAAEVDGFIAVSRHYREVMCRRLGLAPERVAAVHLGTSAEGFGPAAPPETPVIGYTARLCGAKGLDTLVEAFLALRVEPATVGVRLKVSGMATVDDREFVAGLRRRIAEAEVAAAVEFLPALDRAGRQALLRTVSLVAVPAREGEAFGLFVLEALASGVPVVLSRVGSYPELVERGGGVLVEPNDPRALAAAIRDLLADPEKARRAGESGRKAVLEHFSIERMAGDIVKVFQQVLASKPCHI